MSNAVVLAKSLIYFGALVVLQLLVSLISCVVACSARIETERQTDRQTDRHTNTQTKYYNPRCACACEDDDCLSSQVFRTLASDDIYDISIVQQCRLLEQGIGTNYLQLCLEDPLTTSSIVCEAKRDILSWDWASTLLASKPTHHSL